MTTSTIIHHDVKHNLSMLQPREHDHIFFGESERDQTYNHKAYYVLIFTWRMCHGESFLLHATFVVFIGS
jgi:hypothetical protein